SFFFSSRRRHTRSKRDWSSDVCSSDLGGGAKNEDWLQIQADIFDAKIVRLSSEQGPGMGAAMLAAYGCGRFESLKACAAEFLDVEKEFTPNQENVKEYKK